MYCYSHTYDTFSTITNSSWIRATATIILGLQDIKGAAHRSKQYIFNSIFWQSGWWTCEIHTLILYQLSYAYGSWGLSGIHVRVNIMLDLCVLDVGSVFSYNKSHLSFLIVQSCSFLIHCFIGMLTITGGWWILIIRYWILIICNVGYA